MYNITETTAFGEKGKEINFYVDEKIDNKVNFDFYKNLTDNDSLQNYNIQLIKNPLIIVGLIKYSDDVLNKIYEYHQKVLLKQSISPIELSGYTLRTQNLINLLNKLFLAIIFAVEEKYREKPNYQYIKNIDDFIQRKNNEYIEEIYNELIKSKNTLELFNLVSGLNTIYQSQNMFSTLNIIGSLYPTIVAVEPVNNKDCRYIYHNHSIPQIITAFNNFIKEINFYL